MRCTPPVQLDIDLHSARFSFFLTPGYTPPDIQFAKVDPGGNGETGYKLRDSQRSILLGFLGSSVILTLLCIMKQIDCVMVCSRTRRNLQRFRASGHRMWMQSVDSIWRNSIIVRTLHNKPLHTLPQYHSPNGWGASQVLQGALRANSGQIQQYGWSWSKTPVNYQDLSTNPGGLSKFIHNSGGFTHRHKCFAPTHKSVSPHQCRKWDGSV